MSVCQNFARLSVFSVLLISTSQCIPTRRPSPMCLQGQGFTNDISKPKDDVIGGYLVFENHLEPGSSRRTLGRFPSVFHVEKTNGKFIISATAPRVEFNIHNVKNAFALVFLPDGSQEILPLQNAEMQVRSTLQSRIESSSFDGSSTSEVVREQGLRDQQDLLKSFSRDYFGSNKLSVKALQQLLNTTDSGKSEAIKAASKLQMLSFAASFSQDSISFAFNQPAPVGAGFLLSKTTKISTTLQRLADMSQSHDSKPILQQNDLDHVARLHLLLKRMDQLENNMRSLALYKTLSQCNTNAGSALCRQRSKMGEIHKEFFPFIGDKCESLNFDEYKDHLAENTVRNIRSCDSTSVLYSLPVAANSQEDLGLDLIESKIQEELLVLYEKFQETRTALAKLVEKNPEHLQLRTVIATNKPGNYKVLDEKSYFGGLTVQSNVLPQNTDLIQSMVNTHGSLKIDVQFKKRVLDSTKCSVKGAVITLGALPIDLARGGCLRVFDTDDSDDPGQVTDPSEDKDDDKTNDHDQGPVGDKDSDANKDSQNTKGDSSTTDSNQDDVKDESPEIEDEELPVKSVTVKDDPTKEELEEERRAVKELGPGEEREAQPILDNRESRRDDPGC